MTREGFIVALKTADDRWNDEPLSPWAQQVADCDASQRAFIEQQAKEIARLREALSELHAQVQGECPSLLNEDSGGDAKLALDIESLLKEAL